MKYDRPLINPKPSSFKVVQNEDSEQSEDEPFQKTTVSSDQLKLTNDDLYTSTKQRINTFKYFISGRIRYIESSVVWKSSALPFALVSSLYVWFLLLFGGGFNFQRLSPKIPLFYDSISRSWGEPRDKSQIFFIAIFIIISEFIGLYAIYKIFEVDTRLSKVFSWVLVFINILILTAIQQIFSLTS